MSPAYAHHVFLEAGDPDSTPGFLTSQINLGLRRFWETQPWLARLACSTSFSRNNVLVDQGTHLFS